MKPNLPANPFQLALDAVVDIAVARWQIRRLNTCAPECIEVKAIVDLPLELISVKGMIPKLSREIARLRQTISRAEHAIKIDVVSPEALAHH